MIVHRVSVPLDRTLDDVDAWLYDVAALRCLDIHSAVSLRGMPGSRHWHLRRSRIPGTLEITFNPVNRELRMSAHSNRLGSWVEETLALIVDDSRTLCGK